MKKYLSAGLTIALIFCLSAKSRQQQVLEKYFPECVNPPIGATSGADCGFDGKKQEWTISFWGNGRGDCPAGCIEKDYYGSYLLDKNGDVYSGGQKINPEDISRGPGALESTAKEAPAEKPAALDEKLTCAKKDDCFWYQCCSTRPMSKLYREKSWKEANLPSPQAEHCVMECEHAPAPKDQKLACVAHQCMSVGKNLPEIDPTRPVVWIGRAEVIGQCEKGLPPLNPLALSAKAGMIIKESDSPGVAAGPVFTKKIAQWQKEQFDRNPGKFQCEACQVCKDFRNRYLLIFRDDLPKFQSGSEGWLRVDL